MIIPQRPKMLGYMGIAIQSGILTPQGTITGRKQWRLH